MEMIPLKASARDTASKPKQLRRKGFIPAIVYGNKMKGITVQCEAALLHKTFAKAGESSLVELDIDGKKIPVLFKDISFDPISGREIHADFLAIDMSQEIETLIPVQMQGESAAVKELGGVLVTVRDSVKVRCLPSDLPHSISIDISLLTEFHSSVHVKDLQVPKGVKVMDSPEAVIITVQEPRKEEVIAPPTTEAIPAEGAPAAEGQPAAGAEAGKEGAATGEAAPGKGKEKK